MEALEGDPQAKGGESIRSYTDLHYPCNLFADDEVAERACYRLWASHFLSAYEGDYMKASAECLEASEKAR